MAAVPDLQDLWVQLNRPGAERFRQALVKRGIAAPPVKELREHFLKYQSSKQLFAPPPKYTGHVYSTHLDSRWQMDVMLYSQASEHMGQKWTAALVVEDIFSRFLWAELIHSPMQADQGLREILARAGKAPGSITMDEDPGFKTEGFLKLLQDHHIVQQFRSGRNDLAVVDNAIGRLKRVLATHSADTGKQDWASRLHDAVAGFNEAGAPALHGSAPEDLRGNGGIVKNKVLSFDREWEESNAMVDNATQIHDRASKVEKEGGFRVYKQKTRLGRRVFDPHWSREVHTAEDVQGAFAKDQHGVWHPTKEVLPVPTDSTTLPEPPSNLNAKTRGMLQRYADRLHAHLTAQPDHRVAASKAHAVLSEVGNIKQAIQLAGLRTDKVIATFVQQFPEFKMVTTKKGGATYVELAA